MGSRVDFDVSGTAFNQRDDFRMGNGVVRSATGYRTYDGSARAGLGRTAPRKCVRLARWGRRLWPWLRRGAGCSGAISAYPV